MSTTHAAAGLLLAIPVLVFAPHLAPLAALAAIAGGAFPDLDMFVGQHRKTLHYPAYGWFVALPATVVAVVWTRPTTVAVACFSLAAALHAVSDVFGAGLEPRPWEGTSNRAVYLHAGHRWLAPKRWVRYDGAPEDLLLTVVLSVPGLLFFGPTVRRVTLVGIVVAVVYTVVRKRLPDAILRYIE